ncbi:hypothetical protein GCM10023084_18880 [Streptomyces lacrimifluminis]|uniref:Uncharacterized protein n=1 Tax=Streptomyces lacrimifluminis TaxID=1500077 RepID=A0A917KG47_9ACTN|nr:hypothetical protein [Streptomyces lacrimifluminis]GGJ10006.1 hypothetical protein GCM10012282_03250 [Streptomyces lacrimifluminis]
MRAFASGRRGVALPSLRIDLPSFAGSYRLPMGLVELGGRNAATALKLAAVLRNAPGQ